MNHSNSSKVNVSFVLKSFVPLIKLVKTILDSSFSETPLELQYEYSPSKLNSKILFLISSLCSGLKLNLTPNLLKSNKSIKLSAIYPFLSTVCLEKSSKKCLATNTLIASFG